MNRLKRWVKGFMLRHVHGMITCAEFERFVIDYLEENLTRGQRLVFEFHIKTCRECRDYLTAYNRSREIGKAVLNSDSGTLPVDVPEDLISAIIEARKQ